tara:strand:+ start:628 stop:1026 length:399 start_codon:yes stop_codon:yes gene_type:complete
MAITNATIALTSDVTDSALAVSNTTELNTAGTTTGVNTMTSVTKVLSSTAQADLITTGSVSTTHAYVYINNPSTDDSKFFKITIGAHNGADVEEIGRLYAGDFMWFPWDVDDDITCIPSSADDMTIEYMVFS